MWDREEICCFTGHRPSKLPWGTREEDPRCLGLKRRLGQAVREAYRRGCRHFISGMALGCDFYFCEAVLDLRRQHPEVTLEAAVPCPEQAERWTAAEQARYQGLLWSCNIRTLIAKEYSSTCMHQRNRYMVDRSGLLIAAYDGSAGGTRYTMDYAARQGLSRILVAIE